MYYRNFFLFLRLHVCFPRLSVCDALRVPYDLSSCRVFVRRRQSRCHRVFNHVCVPLAVLTEHAGVPELPSQDDTSVPLPES